VVDQRGAEVEADQLAEVVGELLPQRLVPAELVVVGGDLSGGAAGARLDGARAARGGVDQQEADEHGGEDGADGQGQSPGDVGEHGRSLVRSGCGGRWPRDGPAATGRSGTDQLAGVMLESTR